MKEGVRAFAFIKNGKKVGRYESKTPAGAARKAYRMQFPKGGSHTFTIVEVTQGSKKKEYKYKGSVKKVNKEFKVKDKKTGEVKVIKSTKEVHIKSA